MPRRQRKTIPQRELYAAALAQLLPAHIRDNHRKIRSPAKEIIKLFTPDHWPVPHAVGGEDKWWNLTLTLRGAELKAKDAADTSRIAKERRDEKKWRTFMRAVDAGRKPRPRKSKWRTYAHRSNLRSKARRSW